MAFGFYAKNDTGVSSVDDTFFNSVLISKFTVNPGTQLISGGHWSSDTAITASFPSIALACSSGFAVVERLIPQGSNNWTLRVLCNVEGASVTVYVYDNPTITPSSGFGMRVRNSNGQTVFSTSQPYLNIIDQAYHGTWLDWPTRNYDSSRSYAVVTASPAIRIYSNGSFLNYDLGGFRINGGSVSFDICRWALTVGPFNIDRRSAGVYNIIDVTGH